MDEFMKSMKPVNDLLAKYPGIWVTALLLFFVLAWRDKLRRKPGVASSKPVYTGFLSQVLFAWSPLDVFRLSDLVRSIAIFGATGSGKTSGSGYFIGRALARCAQVSLLIFASKPEDREFWQKIYTKAGRGNDLLIFSPDSGLRFNGLDFIQRMGGEVRDIRNAIMVFGETLQNSQVRGEEGGQFWKDEKGRMLDNAITIVRLATGQVSAPVLQAFINDFAQRPEQLKDEKWRQGFHFRCLQAARARVTNRIEQHDCQLALDYWIKEVPTMADKMRSGIITSVLGTLHVFNQGAVRELVSTTTNVSPEIFEQGKSLLIDTAISSHGLAGALLIGMWKYTTQWYILRRKAEENSPVIVLWSDEHQKTINSYDAQFLAESRSHRGCMVCLTQSIHSYYTKLREGGEHEADSYLTNFYHKIFHAVGDHKTSNYAVSLIGRRLKMRRGGSSPSAENAGEELFGKSRFSSNFSENMESILETTEFMQNLRTGGAENGFIVDGIVCRSAQPFSNRESFLKVAFNQRG